MRRKKIASVLLALSLTLGVCACGSQPGGSQESEQREEPVSSPASEETPSDSAEAPSDSAEVPSDSTAAEGEVTLRIAIAKHSADVSDSDDFTKFKKMLRQAGEDLGYNIEWIPLLEGGDAEKLSTMLAGDLPDVFWGLLGDAHIVNNSALFVTLEDKIEEYAPHVYALYEDSVDGWREFLTFPDGHIYGMMGNSLVSPNNAVRGTMWINQKWLDQLDLAIPATMAELENVLEAFRDNDCDGDGDKSNEIPMDWCQKHYAARYDEMAHCFGFPLGDGKKYDIVDGKIVSVVDKDEYRAFLEEYHRLTAEGLVNREGATQTEEQYNSNISSGKVGIFWGWAPYTYISDEEMRAQYVPLPPISADGTTFRVQPDLNRTARNCYVITTACQNVEAAMKLWDYVSQSEETSFSTAFGEEGLTWEYVDGVPTNRAYTAEEATQMGYGEIASNAGTSTFAATIGLPNCGPLMLTARRYISGTNGAIREEAVRNYEPYYTEQTIPKLIVPAEAAEEFAFATDGLDSYITSFACDSILNGVTDDGWNDYISGLSQHGYEYYLEYVQKIMDNAF